MIWSRLGIALGLALGATAASAAPPIAIHNVTIVGLGGASEQRNATVVLTGDRISAVGTAGKIRVPRGARRIDGSGKFLIPGLWDMHVHLFNNRGRPGTDNAARYFPLFLAHGVTGVRDMWSDADDGQLAQRWSKYIGAGKLNGPRIVVGSPMFDGSPASWPHSLELRTTDEARAAVRKAKAGGAQFIKVYERLPREVYFAIADESRRSAIPFAGHVPLAVRAVEAAAAGQRSIEHLTGMSLACSSAGESIFPKPELASRSEILATVAGFDENRCRAAARAFARNGTWHDPTLILLHARWRAQPSRTSDPRLRFVPAFERGSWAEANAQIARRDPQVLVKVFGLFQSIFRSLHAGGTGLLAGTDLGNPHIFAGSSLHDELALMVEAGLSPRQALETATSNPARFLGRERDQGSIAKGKVADMVLLDADPTRDISNVRRISGVVSRGRFFDAVALAGMKETSARLAAAEASGR